MRSFRTRPLGFTNSVYSIVAIQLINISYKLTLNNAISKLKLLEMNKSKLNIIIDYDSIDDELLEQVKYAYPYGFNNAIIEYANNKKLVERAIILETDDRVYMLRLSKENIIHLLEED